jgi:glutamyl-tRNA reductase
MKFNSTESLIAWTQKVRDYELKRALKELKKGKDVDTVMETMYNRIINKILHPIIISLKK